MDLDIYLEGIQARDEQAFAAWLAGAEPAVRRSLRPFASSVDVEAVIQEALLRVWVLAPNHSPDGKTNSLLRLAVRIARNLAVDEARRMNRLVDFDDADVSTDALHGTASFPDSLFHRLVRFCLDQLTGKPRLALQSWLNAEGESDTQLAMPLGMAVNTFRKNVSRARKAVRQCLEDRGIKLQEYL